MSGDWRVKRRNWLSPDLGNLGPGWFEPGFVFVFATFSVVLVQTITDAYSANSFAWALGFTIGNGWCALQLIPRLW
jgi:hypothetical protein